MPEFLLRPCTLASLRKGVSTGALLMLAPPLTGLVLSPERTDCSENALARGRDIHPIPLLRHKAPSLRTQGRKSESCALGFLCTRCQAEASLFPTLHNPVNNPVTYVIIPGL